MIGGHGRPISGQGRQAVSFYFCFPDEVSAWYFGEQVADFSELSIYHSFIARFSGAKGSKSASGSRIFGNFSSGSSLIFIDF